MANHKEPKDELSNLADALIAEANEPDPNRKRVVVITYNEAGENKNKPSSHKLLDNLFGVVATCERNRSLAQPIVLVPEVVTVPVPVCAVVADQTLDSPVVQPEAYSAPPIAPQSQMTAPSYVDWTTSLQEPVSAYVPPSVNLAGMVPPANFEALIATNTEIVSYDDNSDEGQLPLPLPAFADPSEDVGGTYIRFGPYEVRPGKNSEIPIGRAYQPMPHDSISRLNGYVGRDELGLYIREVPDAPDTGLKPSRNGIWVRQSYDQEFRRLAPGEVERIMPDTLITVGGDGIDAQSGFPIDVL